ncbi:MFS transporter [Cryobacterium sandaracinum]|uniref:MFS transporter n=1 Tax=Cryobacterium sandaracinum TaxID=1259247 RepID=A0ABY2JKE6_9MICO|nr:MULTISPECIES: MFS transporter [Cryobacterium]TFC63811.1 MFS transporter [Cryobacterium sp. TMT2-4]TFD05188.1 MFS transporter [Cryobacterium sandaracinum]
MPKPGQSKKIFQLVLLILAGGSIYPLVYLRQNFEATILEVFEMSNAELATLYSMLGIIFVVGYLPSGWLADKFSTKYMITFSLTLTAAAGLFYAQIPDKSTLVYIFLVWGFASVFTFWSSLLKAVNLLADKNEEGRFFGALDGGRGVVEAALATVAVAIFAAFVGDGPSNIAQTEAGFQAVVYMYCAVLIVLAVVLFFVLSSEEKKMAGTTSDESVESTFAAVRRILKIREVWVLMFALFCGYTLFWAYYYFSGYLTTNHAVTPVAAGVVTVVVMWMRPIGGFGGGYLADKLGKSRVLSAAMLISALGLIGLAIMPGGSAIGLVYVLVVLVGLFVYVIRGVYWSLLEDCRVPVAATGIAIGLISLVGYLPDIFLPQISAAIYTAYGDDVAGANNLYFLITAGIGLVGAAAAAYFAILVKRRKVAEAAQAEAEQGTVPTIPVGT